MHRGLRLRIEQFGLEAWSGVIALCSWAKHLDKINLKVPPSRDKRWPDGPPSSYVDFTYNSNANLYSL